MAAPLPPNIRGESSEKVDCPSVDMASDMGLEAMLAMAVKRHKADVEAYKSHFAAQQETILSLTRQLQVFHQTMVWSNTTEASGSTTVNTATLPRIVSLAPEAPGGDASDRRASQCVSQFDTELGESETAELGKPGSPSTLACPSDRAMTWATSVSPQSCHSLRALRSTRTVAQPEFRIKATWEPTDHANRVSLLRSRAYFDLTASENCSKDVRGASPETTAVTSRFWFVGVPTNPARLAWDFVGAALIFYDLFKLPMEAFSPPESAFSIVMDWVVLLFWTANVGASLTVGYTEHGEMVLSPSKIALRYFRTWLALDVLVVVPDWVLTIAALAAPADSRKEDAGTEDHVKLLRVLRLVRMVRLLRLLKLRKIFGTFNDLISSEYVSVIANICVMILTLLVINHLISCMWFVLAESQKHHDVTWTTFHGLDDAHWLYQYTTAFHWSITQFTPASMDVQPQNTAERTFTIVLVVLALVGFSYILGIITGCLGQLRSMHAEESRLFWDLRRYLRKNKVNTNLSVRIQKYLEHAWQTQAGRKPVQDVKLMQLLSEQLRAELKYALAVNHLKIHPFLDQLSTYSSITVHRLANCAISHVHLAADDSLFHRGEAATHMYIVVEGSYIYRRKNAAGESLDEQVDQGKDWIAEPVLWTESWIHLGALVAIKEGGNLRIDAKSFSEQVNLNPKAHVFARGYAQKFVAWLNASDPDNLSDISQGEGAADFIPTDVFDGMDSSVSASSDSVGAFERINRLRRLSSSKV